VNLQTVEDMGGGNNSAGSAAERITVLHGDSREVLKGFPDNHFDSVVTDPPYALVSIVKRFGKANSAPQQRRHERAIRTPICGPVSPASWASNGTPARRHFDPAFWAEVLRVLKPGGHIAAFSGTRTYHRMAVAIEDAGFEIRDQLAWTYGSGFPKSHDVSKGIDKKLGCERTKVRVAPPACAKTPRPRAPAVTARRRLAPIHRICYGARFSRGRV
jgi:DNA modification methylase